MVHVQVSKDRYEMLRGVASRLSVAFGDLISQCARNVFFPCSDGVTQVSY